MSGRFWAHVGAELGGRPHRGTELECLGLILGHPFLEKFGYKSGRQMCGLCPPSLGGKHSRRPGDEPKHLSPPRLFIPGLPLLLGPGLASQSTPELSVLSGGSSPRQGRSPQQQACLNPTRDWALTTAQWHVHWRHWVLLIRNVPTEARAWPGSGSPGIEHWICSKLLHDCGPCNLSFPIVQ